MIALEKQKQLLGSSGKIDFKDEVSQKSMPSQSEVNPEVNPKSMLSQSEVNPKSMSSQS